MGAMLLAMLAPLVPFVASAAASGYVSPRDDAFDSLPAQVDISGRVTWTNRGHSPHDVVADDGSFLSPTMKPGQTYSQVFPKQGAFKYFCSFHGAAGGKGMSGAVYVGEKPQDYAISSQTRTYPNRPPPRPPLGRVIHVPADESTIQAACDAARPGDMGVVAR